MILYGNPSAIAKDSSPHLRRHFLPNVQFEWCMILQGTLGGTFDIFAASVNPLLGCSSGKPRSRPIGVRVCPEAQFNFSSTAFAPRVWTMVVSWREDFGRQPQLITPENEGGDETNCPYPPNFTFFDETDVPFGPQGPQPPAPPELHEPPGSPGLPPGWLPATSPTAWYDTRHTAWMESVPLNLAHHPTHVFLDLGCTRSIGSRTAIRRFSWKFVENSLFFVRFCAA